MGLSFSQQFDQHKTWQREMVLSLQELSDWAQKNDLQTGAVADAVQRLLFQLRSDKLMVAFVAELSRGKSELINALFFSDYGRRVLPVSVGRTTMCPTEFGYDPEQPCCLRLLPIQTRLQPRSLTDWRAVPDQWESTELISTDVQQLAQALEQIAQVCRVELDEARALGLWHDDALQDNPPLGMDGRVEIPKWRHAMVNIPHPLLQSGLVILDTPGLNAVGVEPELTMALIPQAHVLAFVLAADTGVTKSDLTAWREYLEGSDRAPSSRIVVLNKVDALWDELSDPDQIRAVLARQCAEVAKVLQVPADQVVAVSAQKALVAKITADPVLLQASQLQKLEQLLSQGVLGQRQRFLNAALQTGVAQLQTEVERVLKIRRSELTEQRAELDGLLGKNQAVVRQMRFRIEQERQEFESGTPRVQDLRNLHVKRMQQMFELLGRAYWIAELRTLKQQLMQPGIPLGLKKTYAQTFDRLHEGVSKVRALQSEVEQMLLAMFRQLNAEYGFGLKLSTPPSLESLEHELQQTQQSHLHYLSLGNALKLGRTEFVTRLTQALGVRLRGAYELTLTELELWNKAAASQLDEQLRERRRGFAHRIEAIDRIRQATTGLSERIAQIDSQIQQLQNLELDLEKRIQAIEAVCGHQNTAAADADLTASALLSA